ncbi:MAG: nucleotidyltransferase domain-containing protein [Anaerolineae bacterium]
MLTRETILTTLENALQPLPYVHAMWQGGASSFDRVDQWSDIDLQVISDDERISDVFKVVEDALRSLSPIELRYEFPQPTWHGHFQTFYRLKDASPFLLLDFVVQKRTNNNRFLQPEIHGEPIIHFDKEHWLKIPPLDVEAHLLAIRERIEALRVLCDLFTVLTLKEIHRHNSIEALAFYQSWTLRPLVEVLRIQHDPVRYNFHTRYIHYALPPGGADPPRTAVYIGSAQDLEARFETASAWFREALAQVDMDAVRERVEQASEQHYGL